MRTVCFLLFYIQYEDNSVMGRLLGSPTSGPGSRFVLTFLLQINADLLVLRMLFDFLNIKLHACL